MDSFEHDLKRHLAEEAERVGSLPDDMASRVLGAVSRGESNLLRFAPMAVATFMRPAPAPRRCSEGSRLEAR